MATAVASQCAREPEGWRQIQTDGETHKQIRRAFGPKGYVIQDPCPLREIYIPLKLASSMAPTCFKPRRRPQKSQGAPYWLQDASLASTQCTCINPEIDNYCVYGSAETSALLFAANFASFLALAEFAKSEKNPAVNAKT